MIRRPAVDAVDAVGRREWPDVGGVSETRSEEKEPEVVEDRRGNRMKEDCGEHLDS